MSEPLVYVLVINWNGLEHLDACFSSLLESPYENVKFILIDNASTDESVAFVRNRFGRDPRVAFIESKVNQGWSGGNNLGLAKAIHDGVEYVFLLNNDTWTDLNAISACVDYAQAHPKIGALAPKMVLYDTPCVLNSVGLNLSLSGACWDKGLGRADIERWNRIERVAGVCGGAAFFRVDAVKRAGLLPDDFEIYLDDLDLCLRIWRSGYEIESFPAAMVRHKFSATMGEGQKARRKYYLNTRNRLRLIERNFPKEKILPVARSFLRGEAKAVGRAMLDADLPKAGAHLRSWADALAYAPRAVRHRQNRASTLESCPYWDLVLTEPLFFPGIELPNRGWYEPVSINGAPYRPIAMEAVWDAPGGPVNVRAANRYPNREVVSVEVRQSGRVLRHLETESHCETVVDVEPGPVTFAACTLFDGDETGDGIDAGGWLSVETGRKEEQGR